MATRFITFAALCACAAITAHADQPRARIFLQVPSRSRSDQPFANDDVEKRYTLELVEDLENTKDNALLLYTEYTAAAAADMRAFMANISAVLRNTIRTVEARILDPRSGACRDEFHRNIKKIETEGHRAALFCGENHHKYFLGHMIVFRMHLNKSEDYVQRCQKINNGCGMACETTPRMIRWRRLANMEINRVKDDIQHSRRSYKDLLVHFRRKLKHIRRDVQLRTEKALAVVEACVKNTAC